MPPRNPVAPPRAVPQPKPDAEEAIRPADQSNDSDDKTPQGNDIGLAAEVTALRDEIVALGKRVADIESAPNGHAAMDALKQGIDGLTLRFKALEDNIRRSPSGTFAGGAELARRVTEIEARIRHLV